MDLTENKKGISNGLMILILIFNLATWFHIKNVRTISEILTYTFYICIPLILPFIMMVYNVIRKKEFEREDIKYLFFTAIFFAVFSFSFYAFTVSIEDFYRWILSQEFCPEKSSLFIILLTSSIGLLLFYFRYKLRGIYGLTEIGFGILIAKSKIILPGIDLNNPEFYLTYITASIYLVVRGLDNVHQGVTKEPFDPIAKKIYDFLKRPG